MNEEIDYFYRILGLRPGASSAEIKSAYRNLAKFYHPDRDKSPDSEIMYREIRVAYEKLLNWDRSGKTSAGASDSRGSPKRATRTSSNNRAHSRQTAGTSYGSRNSSKQTWTAEEWEIWRRVHFPRKAHEGIFSNIHLSNVFYSALFAALSCASFETRLNMAALYHIISWVLFFSFRRYFTPSKWSFSVKFAAGTSYGLTLALIARFYKMQGEYLGMWLFAAISAWILMLDAPLPLKNRWRE